MNFLRLRLFVLFFGLVLARDGVAQTDLFVTNGQTLEISSGTNAYLGLTIIGNAPNDSNNVLEVVNPGTVLSNGALVFVGVAGSDNRLTISNGATAEADAGSVIGSQVSSANNTVLVSGSNSSWVNSSNLTVGLNGSGNRLTIEGGATVSNNNDGTIGFEASSSNNSALVTGAGSAWTNGANLAVGNYGSSNSLVISNGGSVANAFGTIGFQTNSSNNSVTVTGADSIWSNSGDLDVGYDGSSNRMTLSAGGAVTSSNGYIGLNANSSNNVVTVTGDRSAWTNSGNFFVGYDGSDNSMTISNGGKVVNADGYIGNSASSSDNRVVVTGTNANGVASTWINTNFLVVGNFGSSNSLIISNGGKVEAFTSGIGAAGNSSNNMVHVTGAGSTLSNADILYVGNFGSSNTLNISNGGLVSVSNISYIGHTITSSNNSVVVTGADANGAPSTLTSAVIVVGFVGRGNSLVVSNGGNVSSGLGSIIGAFSNSSNNTAMVTDAGSTWSNSGDLYVGGEGGGNNLVISNGGRVESIRGYIGFETNSSNNTVLVTGTNSNGISTWTNSDDLYVGYDGSGNSLTIESGATVANTFGYIGYGTNSSNNFAVVTGAGSTWSNNGNFIVGHFGSSNRLIISNGGNVLGGDSYIGDRPGSSNNYVLVTDSNSTWTSADRLFVGHFGSSNSLLIGNGATVANTGGVIGSATSSSNNSVLVTGTNANGDVSTWTNSGDLVVGEDGSSNSLVISNGGSVLNAVGYVGRNTNSSNNSVLVTEKNSTWTNFSDLAIGSQGSSNTLVISNGATVANTDGVIGSATTSSNNSVLVTDGGTWTNSGNLFVGFDGSGNSLVISNGGSVVNTLGYIGFTSNSSNNSVLVAGTNANGDVSTWTNSGNLFVGSSASGNSLVISNEGRVANVGGFIGSSTSSSNNSVLVTDGGTWTNSSSLYVGNFGSSNRLVISNGGTVSSFIGHIGNDSASSNNLAVVKGSNSLWTNSFRLYVGLSGSSNSLVISNEGTVANIEGYIGYYAVSSNNGVLVTSNSLWTNSGELGVGFEGSGNNLVISNGGRVANAVGYIGRYSMSSNNSVLVTGTNSNGISTWANSDDLYVGYDGSGNSMTIEGGASVANTFGYIGFGTNSSNNFVVVTGAGSTWSNSGNFIVGYSGSSNSLIISNAGSVSGGDSYIGDQPGSSNNYVLVTDDGSTWTSADRLFVGHFGDGNSLMIANGGQVVSRAGYIGSDVASSNNSVLVTGTNSQWTNRSEFHVGSEGAGNHLVISNGGSIIVADGAFEVGTEATSSNNSVLVTGAGSALTNNRSFYLGRGGGGGSLVISNGGRMESGTELFSETTVGNDSTSSGNSVLVTGSNSIWTNASRMVIGRAGANNSLTIADAGELASSHDIALGEVAGSTNNSLLVTGDGSSLRTGEITVGGGGSSNRMVVTNGAYVTNTWTYLGRGAGSDGNSLVVSGPNSRIDTFVDFNVGYNGSSNTLVVSDGAAVTHGGHHRGAALGVGAGSSNNSALVTGSNSSWTSLAGFFVGYGGSGNSLVISNGGAVSNAFGHAGGAMIGRHTNASNNTVLVTGNNSSWTSSADFFVGYAGSDNSLVITNGGLVSVASASFVGFEQGSVGNTAVVAGTGSLWTNSAIVLGLEGSGNTLTISNDGDVAVLGASYIGNGSNATGNVATVTGTGSTWTSGGNLWVGREGSGNSMIVLDGGFVSVGADGVVGGSIGASNNSLTIGGPLSQWTNRGSFYIGGGANSVTVTNGGTLSVSGFTFVAQNAAEQGNSIVVTGSGSEWTNALNVYFGDRGSGNTLDVLDGGTVSLAENLAIAYYAEASNNTVTVSGSGSSLVSGATIIVGREGSGNRVVVTNRGEVSAVGTVIGEQTNSTGNSVLVTDSGSWTNAVGLVVGGSGSDNGLTISNGAIVAAYDSLLGVQASSSNNSALVTGNGSRWTTTRFFYVGNDGSGNRLEIADGGVVEAGGSFLGATGSSNSALVTGAGSRWTNSGGLYVGNGGSGNRLEIADGGSLVTGAADIGFNATGFNNTVTVTGVNSNGARSSWTNWGGLSVGYYGCSNRLEISDGGQVVSGGSGIGFQATSSNNSAIVTGSNSSWTSFADFFVGYAGSDNSLVITNGGLVSVASASFVGFEQGSVGNRVMVTGTDSIWTNSGAFYVGNQGSGNTMVISNGGQVANSFGYIAYQAESSNNSVVVTGEGSVWTNSGLFGAGYRGSSNSLAIVDGAQVLNETGYIGYEASASNNRVVVSGTNVSGAISTWVNTAEIYLGLRGSGNALEISNGGMVQSRGGFIGLDENASNNTVLVTGAGSMWTNTQDLYVGRDGSGNTLSILEGAGVVNGVLEQGAVIGFGSNASNNSVLVSGNGSTWVTTNTNGFANLLVGYSGSGNSLAVSNEGVVVGEFAYIGYNASASNNSVLVTGADSVWTNSREINVGFAGSGNILTVSNGGLVTAQFAYVGRGGDFNEAVVISNGRVAADVVYVGDTGMSNSFSVLSGGQVEALTGLVGADANATGNMALISGPGAVWSNTFTFFVGHSGSGNNLVVSNGGKLVVGGTGYVGYNMASSNSAVVTGAGSVWTNGGDLYIGYNGNRNSLLIEDGGAVYNVNGYDDGLDPLDNSNMVTVTGSGSRWVNSGNLTFGLAGHGNTLNVYSNGLVTVGTNAILGDLATASNNTVFVAGTGSRLEVGETVFVGKDGGDNLLLLLNGGAVTASSTIIGGSASSVSNHVSLVGGISRLANSDNLMVGHGGSANRLSLITGGVATANVAYVGYSNTSAGNIVFVSGPGAEWSNTSVFLGYHGASNSLNVSGGGRVVTTGSSSVGYAASSSNNSVVIDGSIGLAVWENQGILYLGVDGEGNSLSITNGGNLITQATTVGASAGNLVTVSGGGSVWSNTGTFLLGFNAGNNSVVVSDNGSLSAGSVGIGLGGSSNRMTVSGGSFVQVTNTSIIGLDTNSSNGSVLVTGDGTVWSNAGQFTLGMEGGGHSLTVSDGATLSATDINIAPFTGSEGTLNIGEFGGSNAAGIIDAALIGFGVGTGAVNFNQTNTFALTNTVTGAGSLNQLGSGTLFLGGDLSTFTGTLSAAVGTIVISNLTHLGRTTNMLLGSGGTFDVAQGGTNTISLDMSVTNGTGNIVNSGGGTLVLATNISKSGSVLVLAGGDFVVNGVISGSGAPGSFNSDLVLGSSVTPGPATVTINTPATYVGPTVIRAGSTLINGTNNALPVSTVLTLGDAATDSGSAVNRYDMQGFDQTIGGLASVGPANNVVEGDGTLTVSGPSSTVFNGVLDGAMAVVRAGTGATILGGANTYTGGTTVQSGRLVAANAAALGTGRVTLLGGTLELQSQLDIGSLLWDGAATIALPRAAAGQFLNVTGLLELTNGVNNFNLAGAALPRSPVKLLTSTNLPSLSTNDFGVLGLGSYTLSIDGDSLYLTAQDISYQSFAITPNQVNVAKALDTFIGASGDRGTVSAALDTLAISQYPAAFEQMMPSQYASLPSMAFNTANALNSSLFQRMWAVRVNGGGFSSSGLDLAPLPAEMGGTDDMGVFAINPSKETRWGTFVDGNGVFANAASTGSVQNYRSQSGGVMVGASYRWNGNLSTGVYAGYQGLQAEYDSGRTIDNAVRFGVFGTYDIEDFYFNALVGGAYHGYTVNRYINFGGIDRTATGRPGAGEFDLALGTGYDFKAGNLVFGPFTTLQYTYLGVQGFTETGADSLNLDVSPYNSSSLLYTLGGQAAYNWRASSRVTVTPSIFAGWQHEFLQNGYAINSSFNTGGPAAPFAYDTSAPARDYFYGGAGVTVGVGERWTASFIYSAFAANADVSSQNLYLSIGVEF